MKTLVEYPDETIRACTGWPHQKRLEKGFGSLLSCSMEPTTDIQLGVACMTLGILIMKSVSSVLAASSVI